VPGGHSGSTFNVVDSSDGRKFPQDVRRSPGRILRRVADTQGGIRPLGTGAVRPASNMHTTTRRRSLFRTPTHRRFRFEQDSYKNKNTKTKKKNIKIEIKKKKKKKNAAQQLHR
jgi:hypothetical protein